MALHSHGIDSPFNDALTPVPAINGGQNISITKEPGYKPADSSPNAPERPHRHSNLDGGKSPQGSESTSPDAVVKRVK